MLTLTCLFQIISGWISDRVGARLALTVFAVIWSAATVFMGLPSSMCRHALFGRVLLGIGVSALPTATRAMSAWMPPGEARIRAGNNAFGGAARKRDAPPLVAGLIALVTWRGSFVVIGIVSFGWAILWAWYFRDDPADHPHEGSGRPTRAITPAEIARFAKPRSREDPEESRVPFVRLARRMCLVTVVYFCYGWTLWFFLAWIPQFFLHNYHLNLNSALFSSGVFFGRRPGRLLGWRSSNRMFEKTGDRKKARRT